MNNQNPNNNPSNGTNKKALMLTATVILAGAMFFMLHRKRINYNNNGNIELGDDNIIPVNFDPNSIKIQIVGFRLHHIDLTGIEFSCDVKLANTSNYNLKLTDFGAELYHTNGNMSRYLTSTDNTKTTTIGKHKTASVNNIMFKVPYLSAIPTIQQLRNGGSREFTIKVVVNVNGVPVQQTKKFNI